MSSYLSELPSLPAQPHPDLPKLSPKPKKSRARKAEAEPGPDGSKFLVPTVKAEEVINADHPLITYGRTARDRVGQWVAMRAQEPGISNTEVAKRLGISPGALNSLIYEANRDGWLKFDDPLSRVKYELIPKVVSNLNEFLDKKDRTVTLETAKNTIFKQFQDSEGIRDSSNMVLALKIEAADPETARAITGQIVGRPRELTEAEIKIEEVES
jgi:transposase